MDLTDRPAQALKTQTARPPKGKFRNNSTKGVLDRVVRNPDVLPDSTPIQVASDRAIGQGSSLVEDSGQLTKSLTSVGSNSLQHVRLETAGPTSDDAEMVGPSPSGRKEQIESTGREFAVPGKSQTPSAEAVDQGSNSEQRRLSHRLGSAVHELVATDELETHLKPLAQEAADKRRLSPNAKARISPAKKRSQFFSKRQRSVIGNEASVDNVSLNRPVVVHTTAATPSSITHKPDPSFRKWTFGSARSIRGHDVARTDAASNQNRGASDTQDDLPVSDALQPQTVCTISLVHKGLHSLALQSARDAGLQSNDMDDDLPPGVSRAKPLAFPSKQVCNATTRRRPTILQDPGTGSRPSLKVALESTPAKFDPKAWPMLPPVRNLMQEADTKSSPPMPNAMFDESYQSARHGTWKALVDLIYSPSFTQQDQQALQAKLQGILYSRSHDSRENPVPPGVRPSEHFKRNIIPTWDWGLDRGIAQVNVIQAPHVPARGEGVHSVRYLPNLRSGNL